MSESYPQPDNLATLKVPPHSIEAEQAVIGGLMVDPNAWELVAGLCQGGDFYRSEHQHLFNTMAKLAAGQQPLDVITVSEELDKLELLDQIGGLAYLAEMAKNTPNAANIGAYAQIVHERSLLRRLISTASELSEQAFNTQGKTSAELIEQVERRLQAINDGELKQGGPQEINPILSKAIERIDELFNSEGSLTGITTGFNDLDQRTSGMQKADLIIVAGRPSMGKTTFAMNLVENALLASNRPVLVFSMEMPADAIVMRMLSSLGKVDQGRIRNGALEEEDWPKLTKAVSLLKDKPLFIDDTPALTPTEMRARVQKVYRQQQDMALVMVDYLQLMQVSGRSEGRTAEISEISRSLKAIAKEFNCPVVALSQLNRGLEQRPNKRPVMSDLRESGAIEQDADIIAFIYRDEVYNEDTQDKGVAEVIIGKHRNGPTGTTRLAFLGQYTRFENLAYDFSGDDDE